jgi:1-acyl-sn-glycerol-3-phosphate acyltransferase
MQALDTVITESRRSWLDNKNSQRIIFAWQRVIFWTFYTLGPIWRRSLVNELTEADVVHGTRYVVAGNHQRAIDPFYICTQIPYRIWRHMGTLNYFTANKFMDTPVVGKALLRFGCFPAKVHHKYPFGLDYAHRMLARGNTILIFPEGRRTRPGETPARKGVQVLAHEPNVMVIPAHIEWTKRWFGYTFKLGIGKPFDASSLSAQEILDRVYAQPVEVVDQN